MKIPQQAPNVQEILKKNSPAVFGLLKNEEVMKFISKYNKDYLHWEELRYKKIPPSVKVENIWALLKVFRGNQYRTLKFQKWNFVYVLQDEFQRKLHLLDTGTAGRLGSSLDSISGKERYILSSLMEEAIASSQLEGAATTRKIAKELLRNKKKPTDYSQQMIVNGYKTIQKIVKQKDKIITIEKIIELQREITKDTLKDPKHEGTFRDNNEVVVGDPLQIEVVYHRPPDFTEIPKLMEELCEFANSDDDDFIHPIIKGIILHFLIGYIHPFEDGNGRTARTLFYWYVLSRGYWLFEFMAISRIILRSKVKYGQAYLYTETDDNDLTYFIDYNLTCIEEAMKDMQEYISRKQQEQIDAMRLIKELKDINLRQAEILKELIKEPEKGFALSEIMTSYGVVYQTARNDLLLLTKLGYVDKVKVRNKFLFKLSPW